MVEEYEYGERPAVVPPEPWGRPDQHQPEIKPTGFNEEGPGSLGGQSDAIRMPPAFDFRTMPPDYEDYEITRR